MGRISTVFVACAVLGAGCGASHFDRTASLAKLGGALSVVTVTTAIAMGPEEGGIEMMLATALPSVVLFFGALLKLPSALARDDREARAREDAEARAKAVHDARVARRERMWWLTKRAATSARTGDCAQVSVFDREVWASDVEFYATVFARDVAIARCLGR